MTDTRFDPQASSDWATAEPEAPQPALGGSQPLVPAASIAGRALVTVIAIMTFLAALTAGAAQLVAEASSGWRSSVAREVTIQIRPSPGRDIEADLAKAAALAKAAPGVADIRVYTKAESERLLEPWLGTGLNFDELPVPRVVILRLEAGNRPDFAALRKALTETVRGATLDDHRIWIDRLGVMANTLVVLGIGVTILVLAATGLAVVFATSGAMSGNREIVEVLHFVGASDDYIAREFQRHFLQLGLKGGLIGGICAIVFFLGAGALSSSFVATPGGSQIEALFGTVALGIGGFVAIGAIVAVVAGVTAVVSRVTVRRTLREIG
ncbi:ABC transporter permease [uncultured Alsobacter sp.]|uniref:cell division protein FtsX n=1 Tax=uncultured Alsobacter sp. TaxID=1748258 RepID=UPI0025F5A7FB|nr:ABC transporter permease [uncultured Alsobacter sp.]